MHCDVGNHGDDPGGAKNPTVDIGAFEFVPGLVIGAADLNRDTVARHGGTTRWSTAPISDCC